MLRILPLLLILSSPLVAQSLDDLCQPDCEVERTVVSASPPVGDVLISGLACYYSDFFDGRKTANGEIFRQKALTAAHLTLPFGTWLEVTSVATGKSVIVRVNDRGPFSEKFVIDLSREAARVIGVDRARDRTVKIRRIEEPGASRSGALREEALP